MGIGLFMEGKKKRRAWYGSFLAVLTAVSVMLMAWMIHGYYDKLNNQLFEERSNHLSEITDKVAQIMDIAIARSWDSVATLEQLLFGDGTGFETEEELMEQLRTMGSFRTPGDSSFLLLDDKFQYYASDGHQGYWRELPLIASPGKTEQELITTLPSHSSSLTYLCFLKRLDPGYVVEESGLRITYVALAMNMDSMSEGFSIETFGSEGHTYVVNQDGRTLYSPEDAAGFLNAYNMVTALANYRFIHGGTAEDLQTAVKNMEDGVLEFDYDGTGYFVASHAVGTENWNILLFVPTSVLGAGSEGLLTSSRRFFEMMAVILIIDFSSLVFCLTAARNRKLMEQKEQANQVLEEAARKARSASQAKSEFLSHMSHDIRTPINGIMGMTEIALRNLGDRERVEDCLRKIDGSSHHLLSLINDVLDMSRIESGRVTLNHEPMNLQTTVDNCVSIIGGQLLNRKLELVKECEPFAHPHLVGDELHLRQILINILGNAVKFTPDGGSIYFRVRETGSEGGKAFFHFEIEDTGIGMKAEFLEHIWDAFAQEDNGSRTNYKGTGLGLAITKRFVEMMDGTITVESRLNVGSKFCLELGFDVDTSAGGQEEAEPESGQEALNGMKVLLVEDNELNAEIARYLLEDMGIVVTAAENGRQALEVFGDSPEGTFDAILMDIMMPVMDGLEATKAIRSMNRVDAGEIPILAMTANAYDEDIRRTREAGMNAHLSKPIDEELLYQSLYEIRQAEKRRERRES